MKNPTPTLLFLATLLTLSISAQELRPYRPAIVEGAVWIHYQGNYDDPPFDRHHTFQVLGDSTMEGQAYKKVYRTPVTLNLPWPTTREPFTATGPTEFHALVREDTLTRRIYGRLPPLNTEDPTLTPDTLLFDFGIIAGDPLLGYYTDVPCVFMGPLVADSLSYEVRFGEEARVISTQFSGEFIEGIGHEQYGLFDPFFDKRIGGERFDVVGYCIFDDCSLKTLTSVREIPNVELDCYPNPTTSFVLLEGLLALGDKVEITIHDFNGRILQSPPVPNFASQVTLQLDDLPQGMYLISATGTAGQSVNRVVKR